MFLFRVSWVALSWGILQLFFIRVFLHMFSIEILVEVVCSEILVGVFFWDFGKGFLQFWLVFY